MEDYYTRPLISYMEAVPDFRCKGKIRHDLAEVLVCLVTGFLAGKTTMRRCLKWCRQNIDFLRDNMGLEHGVASLSTASRILSGIDEELFSLSFMEWIGEILDTRGIHLVIDGKALRGSIDKVRGERAPMILNAIDACTKLVLAQLPMENKGCEITAIPEMLKLIDIRGSTVTTDAIGTQTAIMSQIDEQGGSFLMTVKSNQPTTYNEILEYLPKLSKDYKDKDPGSQNPEQLKKYEEVSYTEKNRDRMEYREYRVCHESSILTKTQKEWPWIKTVGQACQVRIPIERDADGNDITPDKETFLKEGSRRSPASGDGESGDIQNVGLISNREMSASEMGEIKRNHWSIENGLHHVLDEVFREDRSTAQKSKNNLALIRKFAYNILRIAILSGDCTTTLLTEAMDEFGYNLSLMKKYIFHGIHSFY